MELVFGVVDIPYVEYDDQGRPKKAKKVSKKRKATKPIKPKMPKSVSTGDVAESLEKRYHIMREFYRMNEEFIHTEVVRSLEGAIVNLIISGILPEGQTGLDEAHEAIAERFRKFLDAEDMAASGVSGVPTRAALEGINHRLKLMKGPRRPSFIDTGQYQAAFKSWTN